MSKIYGVCPDCKAPNTGRAWCNKCDPGKFLKEGNTSGNPEIDSLIYKSQLKTVSYDGNLEWISYDRLQNIKAFINEVNYKFITFISFIVIICNKYFFIFIRSKYTMIVVVMIVLIFLQDFMA